jgi:ankyrin repeat protein
VLTGQRLETVKMMVAAGADVKARTEGQKTMLHWAATSGTADIVRFLVEKGVDLAARDSAGHTALDLATEADITVVLRRAGAR